MCRWRQSGDAGGLVLHRQPGQPGFTALPLTLADTLDLPEAGIGIPVAEIYEDAVLAVTDGS
jgi:hypothetical protein